MQVLGVFGRFFWVLKSDGYYIEYFWTKNWWICFLFSFFLVRVWVSFFSLAIPENEMIPPWAKWFLGDLRNCQPISLDWGGMITAIFI